jgi:hypothetical protein
MPHSKYIKIIANQFGKVATVTTKIPKGMLVRVLTGENIDNPTQTSIQWGHEAHRRHCEDHIGRYINHSCSPTLRVDGSMPYLWAVKDILPNMPLTFNYLENEDNISVAFICTDCRLKVPRKSECTHYKTSCFKV